MKKAYLNWSSGKDAAFALYKIQQEKSYNIEKLVTTINSELNRISMHGVRTELLMLQAKQVEIPLHIIELEGNVPMDAYNEIMGRETNQLKSEGFSESIFGDIFLEDLKIYREDQLKKIGINAVFPLWKMNTDILIRDFILSGFKAITVSVNAKLLDRSFCGRIVDEQFLNDLPQNIDPCGENGEFHTFVFDGPNFKSPVLFEKGEIVNRSYISKNKKDDCFSDKPETWDTSFWFCDLLPE